MSVKDAAGAVTDEVKFGPGAKIGKTIPYSNRCVSCAPACIGSRASGIVFHLCPNRAAKPPGSEFDGFVEQIVEFVL